MEATLGVDLGGTKLLATASDRTENVVASFQHATGPAFRPEQMLTVLRSILAKLSTSGVRVQRVGIGFPGLVERHSGRVHSSVILPTWRDYPLAERIEDDLGVRCYVDNDVNVAARAEARERNLGRGDSMLFVSIGTGVGGALVLDGRIWEGASGLAGEIGHVSISRTGPRCLCGRRGCVNLFASGTAIERQLRHQSAGVALAHKRDPSVVSVVRKAAQALGIAVGSAMNLLNPTLVVLGGGVAQYGAAYLEAVRDAVAREAFPEIAQACRVELTRAGYAAGAYGATILAGEAEVRSRTAGPALARPSH